MAVEVLIALSFLIQQREKEKEPPISITQEYAEPSDAAVPLDEYEELLLFTLMKSLKERNYNLRDRKAQRIVLAILQHSFPYLREDSQGNDEDMKKLLSELSIQTQHSKGEAFEPGSPMRSLRSSTTL